eukprot:363469-Chlamydomonas_euryale.AAC.8
MHLSPDADQTGFVLIHTWRRVHSRNATRAPCDSRRCRRRRWRVRAAPLTRVLARRLPWLPRRRSVADTGLGGLGSGRLGTGGGRCRLRRAVQPSDGAGSNFGVASRRARASRGALGSADEECRMGQGICPRRARG